MLKLFLKFYFLIIFGFILSQLVLSILLGSLMEYNARQDIGIKSQGLNFLLKERYSGKTEEEAIKLTSIIQNEFKYPISFFPTEKFILTPSELTDLSSKGFTVRAETPMTGVMDIEVILQVDSGLVVQYVSSLPEPTDEAFVSLPVFVWLSSLAIFVFLVTYPLYRRLKILSGVAEQISKGNFSIRIPEDKGTETEKLARAFRQQVERISVLLENQKQFLKIVAHEFRTPMTRIQFLLEEIRSETNNELVHQVEEELNELNTMVSDLGKYIQLSDQISVGVHPKEFNLTTFVYKTINRLENINPNITININIRGDENICHDPKLINYVLVNLVSNALRYANSCCEVTVVNIKNQLSLTISDDGPGVEDSKCEWIFEPFHKDPKKGGLGLGLSIVKRIIIDLFQGEIKTDSSPYGGFRVTCLIPHIK